MLIEIKCVICGHKEKVEPSFDAPTCSECFGPVTAVSAELKEGVI